jgi:hypothetical protein
MNNGYITEWKEFEGKTITRVVETDDGELYITFSDETRAVVEAEGGYSAGEAYLELGDPLTSPYDLHKAGWLSKALLDQHQKEQDEHRAKEREKRERKELERLKEKYQ